MTLNNEEKMKQETMDNETVPLEEIHEAEIITLEPTLEQQLAEMKDQWLRAVAETENIRKRGQRDKEDATRYAPTNLARDIVGVADNLRRALDSCAKEDKAQLTANIQSLITGVELIVKELDTTLDRHNIKRIQPLHEKFDPNHHQAMFEIESAEHPAGTVLNIMQDGYLLHDRLLRPAMVGVSKAPAKTAPETDKIVDETV
ncbi:MAG: nucleotide exchange factor GrpE [Pseudomonadota bacterium]